MAPRTARAEDGSAHDEPENSYKQRKQHRRGCGSFVRPGRGDGWTAVRGLATGSGEYVGCRLALPLGRTRRVGTQCGNRCARRSAWGRRNIRSGGPIRSRRRGPVERRRAVEREHRATARNRRRGGGGCRGVAIASGTTEPGRFERSRGRERRRRDRGPDQGPHRGFSPMDRA